jgi:ribosomal protein S25
MIGAGGCGSVIEHLSRIHKALGSTLAPQKKKKKKKKKRERKRDLFVCSSEVVHKIWLDVE